MLYPFQIKYRNSDKMWTVSTFFSLLRPQNFCHLIFFISQFCTVPASYFTRRAAGHDVETSLSPSLSLSVSVSLSFSLSPSLCFIYFKILNSYSIQTGLQRESKADQTTQPATATISI
jgi:hypothetical protein